MDYRIISIGSLSRHELWQQDCPPRPPHATTTLVRSGDRVILVDPSLPAKVLLPRLAERSGLKPQDITDVFLTCFRPAHRWGLSAFTEAHWLISEQERNTIGAMLVERFEQEDDPEAKQTLQQDIALLRKCEVAPDKLADHVDLFPLPGYTPGTCGLLLSEPRTTVLIAGDAVATGEHLEQGRVLRGAFDLELAQESVVEAVQIADVIVPGHDNLVMNLSRGAYG
jgi:glyoxylase-like metal-dependent hydrolase (beta-lactamase superfamily II)